MLAVVDQLAALAIVECGGPAAELGARLEDRHPQARSGERARRAEPGEPRAHDHDVGGTRLAHRKKNVRAHVDAAISARRGLGMRTTAEKTS